MLFNSITVWILFGAGLIDLRGHDVFILAGAQQNTDQECTVEFSIPPAKTSSRQDAQLCNAIACQNRYRIAMWLNEPFTLKAYPPQNGLNRTGLFQGKCSCK